MVTNESSRLLRWALLWSLCCLLLACATPQRPRPEKPADQYVVIGDKTYRIGHEKTPCSPCGGNGNTNLMCAACRGQGQLVMVCFNCGGRGAIQMMGPAGPYIGACMMCGGSGRLWQPCGECFQTGHARCNLCDGAGYSWTEVRTVIK